MKLYLKGIDYSVDIPSAVLGGVVGLLAGAAVTYVATRAALVRDYNADDSAAVAHVVDFYLGELDRQRREYEDALRTCMDRFNESTAIRTANLLADEYRSPVTSIRISEEPRPASDDLDSAESEESPERVLLVGDGCPHPVVGSQSEGGSSSSVGGPEAEDPDGGADSGYSPGEADDPDGGADSGYSPGEADDWPGNFGDDADDADEEGDYGFAEGGHDLRDVAAARILSTTPVIVPVKPHMISQEEFGELGWDKVTIYYYEDGTLADDRNEIIDDPESIVGTNIDKKFGLDSYNPDVVLIRCQSRETDYEVCRVIGPYDNEPVRYKAPPRKAKKQREAVIRVNERPPRPAERQ